MKLTSLGSGSKGNALLVSVKNGLTETTVMFDCGFGLRETQRRLERVGCSPADLAAVIVTHEHSDHAKGVLALALRYQIPVWMSEGTYQSLREDFSDVDIHLCSDSDCFTVGDLQISAFSVSHDAKEPLQFHMTDGMVKFGVLTDTGQITPRIVSALSDCDALMIECNYDDHLLKNSNYPFYLKNRISGIYGHLSNDCTSQFLAQLDRLRLKKIIGAHLSQHNNRPELVRQALEKVVGSDSIEIIVAGQENGFGWTDVFSDK